MLPPVLGPPAMFTVLDLPVRVPLPAKITIEVLKPIDLRSLLGASPDVEEGYRAVTGVMQDTLTRLGDERTLPVLG